MDEFYVHVPSPNYTRLCMLKLQVLYQCHWQASPAKIVQQSYYGALGYESKRRWIVSFVSSSLQQEDAG